MGMGSIMEKQIKLIKGIIWVLLTVALIYTMDRLTYRGTSLTLAPAFAAIVMVFSYGGTWAGAIAGVIVSGYALFAIQDPVRGVIVAGSVVAMVIHMILLRRAVDNGDRVLRKLLDVDTYLAGAVLRWKTLGDEERRDIVQAVHHQIAHIYTLARGWRDLAREREQILDDAYKDIVR